MKKDLWAYFKGMRDNKGLIYGTRFEEAVRPCGFLIRIANAHQEKELKTLL